MIQVNQTDCIIGWAVLLWEEFLELSPRQPPWQSLHWSNSYKCPKPLLYNQASTWAHWPAGSTLSVYNCHLCLPRLVFRFSTLITFSKFWQEPLISEHSGRLSRKHYQCSEKAPNIICLDWLRMAGLERMLDIQRLDLVSFTGDPRLHSSSTWKGPSSGWGRDALPPTMYSFPGLKRVWRTWWGDCFVMW